MFRAIKNFICFRWHMWDHILWTDPETGKEQPIFGKCQKCDNVYSTPKGIALLEEAEAKKSDVKFWQPADTNKN